MNYFDFLTPLPSERERKVGYLWVPNVAVNAMNRGAAPRSIAVEFSFGGGVGTPRVAGFTPHGVNVRSLVSQPCYTYWERHPVLHFPL